MATSTRLMRSSAAICQRSARTSLSNAFSIRPQAVALPALARYYASKSFPPHSVVSMPALSPTMTAGNIGAWQKKPGDNIAPGDVLVEIETDKAQMDFEFQEEGTLAKILKDTGEKDVAVGSPIAVMVEEGADVSAFDSFTVEDAGGDKTSPKDAPEEEAAESSEAPDTEGSNTAPPSKGDKEGSKKDSQKDSKKETSSKSSAPESSESDSTGSRLQSSLDRMPKISPSAQKLALEKGVAIGSLKGTGPGGQITKSDVEKFKPAAAASPAAAATGGAPTYEDLEASSMRKTIAKRLTESMNQNPHYFVASTISVTKLLKLRQALNSAADGKFKLSVNDFLIKALAVACRKVPAANSSWREADGKTFIRQHNTVDVSVAVATPVGLMTPIVKGANGLGLEAISAAVKDLGKRARDGKLKPEEYQGGSVTISNMGMNAAIDRFTAVINPPQACIIAVGTTKKVAVPGVEGEDGSPSVEWDDQIVITGSFDHKVVDGAVGGDFMKELKRAIENPLELML